MADDIKQTFSLDASQALEALNLLDSGFVKLQKNLESSLNTFTAFNSGAGKTVSALIQIKTRATEAADALARLNTIKPPASIPGGGLPSLPGAGSAESGLLSGSAAASAMNALLGQTATQAKAAGAATKDLGDKAEDGLNRGGRAAGGFALSLETITRVIGTQLIVRGLNAIRNAVEQSFQGFIDFNRSIAEIQTISTDPVEKLASGVRELSDAFNAPILDVAKAKYEILSNGFESTAESTTILTAALKFAKVGISDIAQAGDLLSTSLNSYGKSADEAETVSAKLFKTIELGRVVGSELATSFGRVAPIAHETGVSMDEVLAAFSSITIGGVKASEAATQIRSSLTALLKPSTDMKEALASLGFETGQQIIQAEGYKGALDALIGTTDGTTTAIAKLFPNVRAINGVLRETGLGAEAFEAHLKAIQDASRELLNQKFEIRISSDAENVATDLNKIKNFFTVDLGSQLVGFTSDFLKLTGGVDTTINVMGKMAPVVGVAVAALLGYNIVTLTTTGLNRLLSLSFADVGATAAIAGGGIAALVAALAAFQAGKFIGEEITKQLDAPFEQAKADAAQLLQFENSQSDALAQIEQARSDKKIQILHQTTAEVRKEYADQEEAAQAANQTLIDNDSSTLSKLIAARQKYYVDLKRDGQTANNDVIKSREDVNKAVATLEDTQFNFSLNRRRTGVSKSVAEQQRAIQLSQQAASQLTSASRPEDIQGARLTQQRADNFARMALSTAQTTNRLAAQYQAEQTILEVQKTRIQAETTFQKNRADDAKRLEDAAAAEKQRVTELKDLTKQFLDTIQLFDKGGVPKDNVDALKSKADSLLAQIKDKAFGKNAQFDISDLISFDKLQRRLNSFVTPEEIKDLEATPDALNKLHTQIQGSLDARKYLISVGASLNLDPKTLQDKSLKDLANTIDTEAERQKADQQELRQASLSRVAAEREIASNAKLAADSYAKQLTSQELFIQGLQLNKTPAGAREFKQDSQELDALRQKTQDYIKLLQAGVTINPKTIDALGAQFTSLQKKAPSSLALPLGNANEEYQLLVKIYETRAKTIALDKAGNTDAALEKQNQQLGEASNKAALRSAATKTAADAENQGSSAIQSSASGASRLNSALGQAAANSGKILVDMRNTAASAAQAAASSQAIGAGGGQAPLAKALGGLIQRFASGGLVGPMQFFNSGGAARGTDTIPAMLSPNEMVINATSSRKFFSQLQAINAGIQPSSNAPQSGATFNIGDINVNEASDAKATAREVINQIRREQRRGTGYRLN